MATTPKKGDRVRVTYEGRYTRTRDDDVRMVEVGELSYWSVPHGATIEVIEEPYEEGAIYSTPRGYLWMYKPVSGMGHDRPWVFVSGPTDYYTFGERIKRSEYAKENLPLRKLAPASD